MEIKVEGVTKIVPVVHCQCGGKIDIGDKFCRYCGGELDWSAAAQVDQSRSARRKSVDK
jgi:hypothetical protein